MNLSPSGYNDIVLLLKEKIRNARLKAVLTANAQLLEIYWEIGKVIAEQEESEGWGTKTIDRLSVDLRVEFEDMKGFSIRNLRYMRDFYKAYPFPQIWQQLVAKTETTDIQSISIWQQLVAKLPWGHHTVILLKAKTLDEKIFFIQKCVENNWSRSVLSLQIENNLFLRSGKAITNFNHTLPPIQADLAVATFKNPYLFDFMAMGEKMQERELEKGLIEHLKKFMRELGRGFAYVGNQYNLKVEGDDFFLDLLFYSIPMKCYVIFELKIGEFEPEYAGKLNFYINTVDAQIKTEADNKTIGVLLCKTPNETVVKFALQGIQSPMGVSEFQLADALPKQLKAEMPTIEELEKEIEQGYEELKSPSQKRLDALKEKLAQLKGPEVKQTATTPLLFDIVDYSLVPLYQMLLKRLNDFKDLFVAVQYFWKGKEKDIDDINQLAEQWKDEEFLKRNAELYFIYQLHGFKKAGTDAFMTSFQLNFRIDVYWWGFILMNYNNQQAFLKKLYGEQLSKEDMEKIADTACEELIKNIEWNVARIKNK
jgi:predicted nuclease of restriction endonuclease-like (RecB) superfamily